MMMPSRLLLRGGLVTVAIFLVVGLMASGVLTQGSVRDFAKLDVCRLVPGESVAKALGGKFVESRPFADKSSSRCAYFVIPAGSDKRLGYVVWLQPAGDFEELRRYIEEPTTPVAGLGDGAYEFQDKGDGRFKINVLKRGDVMFQATAESAEAARKVAAAVAAQLGKR
jgi:hypothetical protein